MKRSEMIQILMNAVQKSNGDFGEYDEERAEFVLKKLEKAGMQPPCYIQIYEKGSRSEHYYPDGFPKNEWEPE